jgi:hypothetical protein
MVRRGYLGFSVRLSESCPSRFGEASIRFSAARGDIDRQGSLSVCRPNGCRFERLIPVIPIAPAAGGGPNRLVESRDDEDIDGHRTRSQDLHDGLVLKLAREKQPLRSGRPVQPSMG